MLLTGVMIAFTDGPLMALVQIIVPPDKQGRVFTVIMSVANLATPVGLAIAGPISDKLGVSALYTLSGIACLVTALVSTMMPAVMQIGENHNEGPETSAAVAARVEVGSD
jgi:DHA3 family macrolide efflux protein-like MFS transporter